jgi:hypothetical protein
MLQAPCSATLQPSEHGCKFGTYDSSSRTAGALFHAPTNTIDMLHALHTCSACAAGRHELLATTSLMSAGWTFTAQPPPSLQPAQGQAEGQGAPWRRRPDTM